MPRTRSLLIACSLLMLVACRPTVCGTGRHDGERPSAPLALYAEQEPAPKLQNGASPIPTAITPGECPADLAEELTPYLGDVALLRLPAGVNADNFVAMAPGFVRLTMPAESTNCREGWPGGLINFMALIALEDVPNKSREQLRAELLETCGYPQGTTAIEGGEQAPGFELWAYEVPATDEKPEPAKMLLALRAVHGRVFALIYECHPNAWPVLVNTFVESGTRAEFPPL